MQRIERYGVIALVFLLVTIVAVSLWGEQKKAGGLFSFLERDGQSARVDRLVEQARPERDAAATGTPTRGLTDRILPMGAPVGPTQAPFAHEPPPDLRRPVVGPDPDGWAGSSLVTTDSGVGSEPVPTDYPHVVAPPQPGSEPWPEPKTAAKTETVPARPAGPRAYTIQDGDTLGEIALRELGTSKRWPEIVALNQGLDPAKLWVGKTIQLPPGGEGAQLAQAARETRPAPDLGRPAPAPARPAPSTGSTYSIRDGDTFSAIAARELGDADRWPEIVALNQGVNPTRLWVGQTIHLPPQSGSGPRVADAGTQPQPRPAQPTPAPAKAGPAAGRSYSVRAGDTLGRIAASELGSSRRWPEIAALNPKVDPEKIVAGQRLILPPADVDLPATRVAQAGPARSAASSGTKVR